MSRRLALLLLVVLAVPALALAADTDPQRKINAADERKAASIVLKRTDFAAGWKRTTTPNSDDEQPQLLLLQPGRLRPDPDGRRRGRVRAHRRLPVRPLLRRRLRDRQGCGGGVVADGQAGARALPRAVLPERGLGAGDEGHRRQLRPDRVPAGRAAHGRVPDQREDGRSPRAARPVTVPLTLHIVVVGRGRAEAGSSRSRRRRVSPPPTCAHSRKLLAERMKVAGF